MIYPAGLHFGSYQLPLSKAKPPPDTPIHVFQYNIGKGWTTIIFGPLQGPLIQKQKVPALDVASPLELVPQYYALTHRHCQGYLLETIS